MNKHTQASLLIAAALIGSGAAAQQNTMPPAMPSQAMMQPMADPAVETRMAMRKLWEDHITYTRNYIISALGGLPDADAIAQRLLANQADIGNAIKPYYGDAA